MVDTNDHLALESMVRGIPPIRSRRGPRRRRPGKLHADKAYDFARHRQWLRQRGISPRIARRGIARRGIGSTRGGRYRWGVERAMAWWDGCRRLHRRYERTGDQFLGFAAIACALICDRCCLAR